MTAPPIPIQPVSIRPELVGQAPPSPWVQIMLDAVKRRQELDLAKQKLAQDQQQFELNSKLVDKQVEGVDLDIAKKKRDFKNAEDDLVARDTALQLFTGNLPRLQDAQGLGQVLAGVKDAKVAGHLLQMLGDAHTLFRPPDQSFSSIGQTPEGTPVILNTKTGRAAAGGPTLRQPTGGITTAQAQKIKLGARNAYSAARQAVALVQRDSTANIVPDLSTILGSAAEGQSFLKGAAGLARRRAMTGNQNKFQNLLNIVAHNSVGLLPGSRQSLVLFQNLRDSYSTAGGDPPELRAQKLALLQDLAVGLRSLAAGEDVSLAHLPGFEDFEPFGFESAKPKPGAPVAPPANAGTTLTAPNPGKYFRP